MTRPPVSREPVTPRVGESREPGAGSRVGVTKGPDSREGTKGAELAPPPPQVAARPAPVPAAPPTVRLPAPPRDVPPVTEPERSSLTLGGPPPGISVLPQGKPAAPTQRVPGGTQPTIRDQIASLGSGLYGDVDEPAKQTLPLDSKDPVYLPYLARLKRRIQNEWVYPEEAWRRGVSGELLLVFTLNKNGSLTNVRLVHSSGFPILDEEALRAIKQAAPYDPFPPQMGEEPWNISASFHYYLPYRFRRN
ncbi:MAG: energy transducer TonB [Candidatus Methylomirabilota bacterium]